MRKGESDTDGNCHFMFGTVTGISLSLILGLDFEESVLLTSTAMLGSIAPDIDAETSAVGNLTKPISTLIYKVNASLGHAKEKHRSLFHDLAFWIGLLVLSLYKFPVLKGFFIGGLSHLFLDMFNPSGVPLFFVFNIRLARLKSNSKEAVVLTAILTVLFLTFSMLYHFKLIRF